MKETEKGMCNAWIEYHGVNHLRQILNQVQLPSRILVCANVTTNICV